MCENSDADKNPTISKVTAKNAALRTLLAGMILNIEGLAEDAERVLRRAREGLQELENEIR